MIIEVRGYRIKCNIPNNSKLVASKVKESLAKHSDEWLAKEQDSTMNYVVEKMSNSKE